MDNNAYVLSFIRLIKGRMPTKLDEVTVTQSITDLNCLNVGSYITLNEKSYIVTRIISDFGRLWPRIEFDYNTPNVFLSESESFEHI